MFVSKTSPIRMEPLRQLASLTVNGLHEAYHSRIICIVSALFVAGFTLALFVGEVAISDTEHLQSGILAAFLRPGIIFILSIYVISSFVRDIQEPSFLVLLSLPIQRSTLIFARLIGFGLLSLLIVLAASTILSIFVPFEKVLLWSLTLWLESLIVIAFSLVCALSFTQVPLAIALTGAFYILSRCIAAMLLIAHNPTLPTGSPGQTVLVNTVDFIALLLPNLDQYARAEYIMYGAPGGLEAGTLLIQSTIYTGLLIGVALFDLYRKNF